MRAGSTVEDFVAKISRALEGAGRRGIHVTAGSCDLEAQQFDPRLPEEEVPYPTGRPHHLESPVGSRDLGGHDGTSRLCYFLDGVQSSREIGRIGMSPVVVSTVAAAIEAASRWPARLVIPGNGSRLVVDQSNGIATS